MNLFQEYKKQQSWRDWQRYLSFIPYCHDDSVLDLGCSVGDVTRLFATRVKQVVGIDRNPDFIDFCQSKKIGNETFICSDFLNLDDIPVKPINGVWSSFSLSYLREPLYFLVYLRSLMQDGAWIALLDVSCFISGNLPATSKYYERVRRFELSSYQSGIYDFDFGAKMPALLQSAGFDILHVDNDVTDPELNFSGAAPQEIIDGWVARLKRMDRLKDELGPDYGDFCSELLSHLDSVQHKKRRNVRFAVANKRTKPNASGHYAGC